MSIFDSFFDSVFAIVILVIVALVVLFFVFMFFLVIILALWEKRPLRPYVVPPPGEEYEPSEKANDSNGSAKRMGFHYCGCFHHGKGGTYKIRCDFWVSPDGSTLAIIGSGSIARLPVYGIFLYTRQVAGPILYTTNEIGEQDISGAMEQETWPETSFRSLFRKHEHRLTDDVIPFSFDDPLEEYESVLRTMSNTLVDRGLAYYTDEEETMWRFSLKGAFSFYFITCWIRPFKRAFGS